MADFVGLGFDLAFKYRTPSIILADGIVGQMMEKVVLPPQRKRRTDAEIAEQCPWAVTGKPSTRSRNVMTTLELDPAVMEEINNRLQAKVPHNRGERSTLPELWHRRCRLPDCGLRLNRPHLSEVCRGSPRTRSEDRTASPDNAVAVPHR